jgi:DNA-binding PucR family transcriptional regulator
MNKIFPRNNDFDVTLGISTLCKKVDELKKGLGEAEKTINIMTLSKSQVKVKSYKDLGAIAKFIGSGNFSEIKLFAHELLDDIKAYDEKYGSDLLYTLYWYLENNGHAKDTANDMRVSLGSVRYRLSRIQEIGGFDLSTSKGFFDAHTAVQIFLLLGLLKLNAPN